MTNPYLKLLPSSTSINVGETFPVDIVLETESSSVLSIDAYIKYDPTLLEVISSGSPDIKNGTLFETTGSRFINGDTFYVFAINKTAPVTRSDTVATMYFRAKKTGSADISALCSTGDSQSSQIILNANTLDNVIDCKKTSESTITTNVGNVENVLGASDSNNSSSLWFVLFFIFLSVLIATVFVYRVKSLRKKIITS